MRAVLLVNPGPIEGQPLHITEIDTPEPGPGQLLVKVAACGVCRSNLHMVEGDWLPANPAFTPIVPGHEVVGTVAAPRTGRHGLRDRRPGRRHAVMVDVHALRVLPHRARAAVPEQHFTGETVHGGYAEHVLAVADHTYAVPINVSDAEAAPLFCPGITAYGSVAKARLSPSRSIAVFGIGGAGHVVLQMAALHGGEVVAVTRSQEHRDLALEVGATRVVDATAGDPGELIAKRAASTRRSSSRRSTPRCARHSPPQSPAAPSSSASMPQSERCRSPTRRPWSGRCSGRASRCRRSCASPLRASCTRSSRPTTLTRRRTCCAGSRTARCAPAPCCSSEPESTVVVRAGSMTRLSPSSAAWVSAECRSWCSVHPVAAMFTATTGWTLHQ